MREVRVNSKVEWQSNLLSLVSVVAFDCFHRPVIENTVNNRL